MGLASVLPFLAALKKSSPDFSEPDISQEFQHSGSNAALDMSQQPQSVIPKYLLPSEQGPPAPPPQQQDTMPPPDLSVGQPTSAPIPQGMNAIPGLAESMPQGQQAPNLRSRMYTANNGGPVQLTKAGVLTTVLKSALMGGLHGVQENAQIYSATGRNAGFGGGFGGATQIPMQQTMMQQQVQRGGLENELLSNQVQYAPLLQRLGILKSTSDIKKTQSQITLEQAQAAAAPWKTGPDGSLINIQTGQTYQGQTAPLSAEEAQALGKNEGDLVPIKVKNTASEIVTRGHANVSTSEGVFDYNRATGQKTRLGTAPAMAVINNNQITDDASLNMAADYYAQTGQLPSGFGRSPATSAAVIKRAAERHTGESIATNKLDFEATKKYMTTLNGTQQVRLRQAIGFASDSLDKLQGLYNEWQNLAPQSGYKILNKATLSAMKNVPGRPGTVATALDAQIADLTSELGNIYMGGNSPTDHSLSLAQKNLSADWNKETFDEAISQVRKNLYIRQNSIMNAAPAGISPNSPLNQNPPNGGPPAGARVRDYSHL